MAAAQSGGRQTSLVTGLGWDRLLLGVVDAAGTAAPDAASLARRPERAGGADREAPHIPAPRSHAFSSSTHARARAQGPLGVAVDDVEGGAAWRPADADAPASAGGFYFDSSVRKPYPVVWSPPPPAAPTLHAAPSHADAPRHATRDPAPLAAAPLVPAELPGTRYAETKQRVEEAREKLRRLQHEGSRWRSKADEAEAAVQGLNQRLTELEERDKALASMDQLKVDKMTRESQLAQAEERVQRGAVREREADAKISQLQVPAAPSLPSASANPACV